VLNNLFSSGKYCSHLYYSTLCLVSLKIEEGSVSVVSCLPTHTANVRRSSRSVPSSPVPDGFEEAQHNSAISLSFVERENVLFSKGWTKVKCDIHKRYHWFTPERKRGFRFLKSAEEYSGIIDSCNNSEDDSWIQYCQLMKEQHRKVCQNVLLGLCSEKALQSQAVDSLPENGNDDECFACGDGGGKKWSGYLTFVSSIKVF
jgi:hypothetical protein